MLHSIPPDSRGPLTAPMIHAVETCVHCGFCLAACPTYQELGQEMDSPRGRIVLMKEVLEGKLSVAAAQPHIDRCLGCLACEPACPSGVPYRDLISPYRSVVRSQTHHSTGQRVRRALVRWTLPSPVRFRWAITAARLGRWLRPVLPSVFRPLLDLAPASVPAPQSWPFLVPALGPRRGRVALLTGCAQQVLAPDITAAALAVLSQQGIEVVVPASQGCCGGLAWHTGDLSTAQRYARRTLDAFPDDVDAILTTAAGCGSAMHEYALILRGTSDEARAERFRLRVKDASRFLVELGLRGTPRDTGLRRKVAYHDACHLSNAQGVHDEPRHLLRAIPGVEVCELAGSQLCCGSAGTYNLDQPAIAEALGEQKARAVIASGAETVVSGNIGCLTQLEAHLKRLGSPIQVRHTLQLLRDALVPPT